MKSDDRHKDDGHKDDGHKDDGHEITIEQAAELTHAYQKRHPHAERAGLFDRAAVERVLHEPRCTGIRIYHGLHRDGREAIVVIGVDRYGHDIVDRHVIDEHSPCPPNCDPTSPLNS